LVVLALIVERGNTHEKCRSGNLLDVLLQA
jgi:hypothetical protein